MVAMFTRFWPLLGLLGCAAVNASSLPAMSTSTPKPPVAAAQIAPLARPLRLVALGASDVVGVGAANPATDGWAPVLARLLPGRVSLMRLGISGATAGQIRQTLLPKALAARPDVAVVFTGVNDCAFGSSLAQFSSDLDGILAGLAATGAQVYVLDVPDIEKLPAVRPYAPLLAGMVPNWQQAIKGIAHRNGAHVVDLAPYTSELVAHPEYLASDGYHPSTAGYKRIAEAIAAAMAGTATAAAS